MTICSIERGLYTQAYNGAEDLSRRNSFVLMTVSASKHMLLGLEILELGFNEVDKSIFIELGLWVCVLNIEIGIDDSHNLIFVSID